MYDNHFETEGNGTDLISFLFLKSFRITVLNPILSLMDLMAFILFSF
jgi:hypothetical protein